MNSIKVLPHERQRALRGTVAGRVLLRLPEELYAESLRCAARAKPKLSYSEWLRRAVRDAVLRQSAREHGLVR